VSSRQAAAEHDTLVATKVRLPSSRPDLVARPRLLAHLDQQVKRGLVLVCAPAGYGKTVLVTEWARNTHRQPAWLSLDAADNDPARFWRHTLAALEQVRPGIGDHLGPLSGPPTPSLLEALATGLINELVAEPGEGDILLVLDDYHLIDAPQIHDLVGFLLEHRPPSLHLLLASRADPPLALARLRAREELGELRIAELRFTAAEAAALLRQAATWLDSDLPDSAVQALASRTEGWAAGLQLAALSLRGQSDVAGFITAFTGSHRHVLDYLTEEVLERQSEDVRTFLIETSVLERLSGPLCDAVTGQAGSQAMLEQVERAGLFLLPLDEVRGWWRYHHLFADLLRARLKREPARTAHLHRNAAAWYDEHGLADDAIHHSLTAGDTARAARLIEENFDTVFNLRGEEATIARWLPALPDDVVRSRPRLLLAQAQMAAMRGDVQMMEPLIAAAEQASATASDEPFEPTAGPSASLLVNVPAVIELQRSYIAQLRGDAETTAARTTEAMRQVRAGEAMLSSAIQGFLAMAEWLRGRLNAAEQGFAANIASWRREGQVTTVAWGDYQLARIQRAQGHFDASVRTCEQNLEFTTRPGQRQLPAAGPAFVGLAEVAYQRNELDAAQAYVTDGIALSRQFVHTPPLAAGLVTMAWIRQAMGDPDAAIDAVDEADRLSPGPSGLLNPVPAQRARLLVAQGDLDAAAGWTTEQCLAFDDEPDYPREPAHLVLARVLIAQGRPDRARTLLDRLATAAANQQRTGSLVEVHAVRAVALAAADEQIAALDELAIALRRACPQGHVRVFTDEGAPMAALLGRLIAAQRTGRVATEIAFGWLARVQRSFPSAAGTDGGTALVDPLTTRELEVLELMALGRSNPAIAAELVVSLDTVKKHVSHILTKLGASNRTEAVARGRQLGLSH
jgi:LuxR family maltose regulon positive regulatory protein